jgi:hypothetical protein
MKRVHLLAKLNGRILKAFSQRTTNALRAALPLRLALPHIEPILALNIAKEVDKDRLVIMRASEPVAGSRQNWDQALPELLAAAKKIDSAFLARVGTFPVGIVIDYEKINPIRAQRMKLLYEASLKILAPQNKNTPLHHAVQEAFSQATFEDLLNELFRLYAEETRLLSHSVHLPRLLIPLRELITQELFNIMIHTAKLLAHDITAITFRQPAGEGIGRSG